ncbi:DedA family protein [Rufibacter roseus]|uniref:DedA family protein n=2 Tax=Rufibacter roseus TaxID=1567108 RepID=A0ABW2DF85_9BACT
MELLHQLVDFILHVDHHLVTLISNYESWVYLVLFLIIFCETGLVVFPFLPGDSLLFALGALAAVPSSELSLPLLLILLFVAAVLGDSFNYYTGSKIGARVYLKNYWFLKSSYIDQTQHFFAKHGGKTIIYARFIPIIRTFAPFVAGIGKMNFRRFAIYNVVGAVLWVGLFLLAGYAFGNIPVIKRNFSLLILGIMVLSVAPPLFALGRKALASTPINHNSRK